MMQRASYSCTALMGTNKTGKLTPDTDGYYTLVLGALNVFNSGGAYYPLGPAKAVFESSSGLMRRIEAGNCKGECGHPKQQPGQSVRDYLGRLMRIEETLVCCHFKEVWLEEGSVKDKSGRPVVAVIAKVRPTGPLGPALKAALENPHENVCFSVRSLTNDTMVGGVLHKNIKTIVCWDWVTEPGIAVATKYNSPSLESMTETTFTADHLSAVQAVQEEEGIGTESGTNVSVSDVMADLGWGPATAALPPSARW